MPERAGNWWVCEVVAGQGSAPERVVVVESHAYPDGTRVRLTRPMADTQIGAHALSTAELDDDGAVRGLHVDPSYAAKAPPLWFAEIRETTGEPPATNLVAFTGAGVAPGRLLDDAAVRDVGVTSDDQVGAFRWLPATGRGDQLYVQPAWRRRTVAGALLAAAEVLAVARDWPRLWGDGQRTQLGEEARNARTWAKRTEDLTHLHPPMTPEAGTEDG